MKKWENPAVGELGMEATKEEYCNCDGQVALSESGEEICTLCFKPKPPGGGKPPVVNPPGGEKPPVVNPPGGGGGGGGTLPGLS